MIKRAVKGILGAAAKKERVPAGRVGEKIITVEPGGEIVPGGVPEEELVKAPVGDENRGEKIKLDRADNYYREKHVVIIPDLRALDK